MSVECNTYFGRHVSFELVREKTFVHSACTRLLPGTKSLSVCSAGVEQRSVHVVVVRLQFCDAQDLMLARTVQVFHVFGQTLQGMTLAMRCLKNK